MTYGGRKWKILENAVGVGAWIGLRRRHTRWRDGESGVEDFSQIFGRVFCGRWLGRFG